LGTALRVWASLSFAHSVQGIARVSALLALILSFGLPAHVLAQAPQSPSAADRQQQQIQEQQQQQLRDRQEQFRQQQQKPPTGAQIGTQQLGALSGQGCAPVKRVRFEGMTRYAERDFAQVGAKLISACTDVKAIGEALRAITNHYIADGYVTSRAFIGPQSLKDGTLTITVFEGRIAGFGSKGQKGAQKGSGYTSGEIGAAFPNHKGDILNLRALEQGIDQLARLADGDPKLDIAPGDTPATSLVLVKRAALESWLRPSLSFNNEGAATTGRWLSTLSLDADSPLGVADQWSFYYTHDLSSIDFNPDGDFLASKPPYSNESYGMFVSVPHGWWTLSASAGGNDYQSQIQGLNVLAPSNGKGWNASLSLDRMLYRNATTKLSATMSLSLQDTTSTIAGIVSSSGSYRMVTLATQLHYYHKFSDSLLQANVSYNRGLDILGAYSVNTGADGPTINFNTITTDMSWQKPFKQFGVVFSYVPQLKIQWGLTNVFAPESFYLGGTSTVRGFNDAGVSGRTGILLRNTLTADLLSLGQKSKFAASKLSAYIGYDTGAIKTNAYSFYERGTLRSVSWGLRLQNKHLLVDTTFSKALQSPSWVTQKDINFSINARLGL
jgi:hemolysin activation/secretion protein